ncbi:FeoA family protein [Sinomicrobium weinanense]|uniref:Ferrous iron transport protein A n=1 Tax=Sinomicrobium weinanense TaxID=2842200 RepID=A0A926Q2Q4_9FLAO|nr:FeoA family protein [Sinomicrobium weinanense]MBC9794920.1 ferrous iron transport protein A [Sinomicrobium weinanense]MBU3125691.1 ferrous iron transport protein A [Sinomicrobium weinanense]
MKTTIAHLKRGEKGIIKDISIDNVPVKLFEMGCLPGNEVELLQVAPFRDPLYLNINGSFFSIRRETALLIEIEKLNETRAL